MQNKPECKEPDLISIKDQGSQNRYMILLLILVGVLMAVVDGSVVSIALPTITGYFRVSLAQSQWVMTSYLVTLTSLLLIFGKVFDQHCLGAERRNVARPPRVDEPVGRCRRVGKTQSGNRSHLQAGNESRLRRAGGSRQEVRAGSFSNTRTAHGRLNDGAVLFGRSSNARAGSIVLSEMLSSFASSAVASGVP